jgi:diaminohydroxyphosphoribosylaminopyrimidine deaminase/5-amino-6-(5-phosphoribosylamino)uracil reductase
MAVALALAARGLCTTSPNPRVGCVIVRDGVVIGRGHHARAGGPHAEVAALADCRVDPAGATVYVTLEPCAHHGRTPPCVDALIGARVGRVVIAMRDPNPQVAGRGEARLRAAGIRVDCGAGADAARRLNAGYVLRHERGWPLVRLKVAASLDGRTATAGGESKWITGTAARADVQAWRARSCAVLTGIGTVLADDPLLTVRELAGAVPPYRQPLRVVADSHARIDAGARVLNADAPVLHVTAAAPSPSLPPHVHSLRCGDGAQVSLPGLLRDLGARGVNELLVEAGPTLTGAFVRAGLWDEAVVYLAPMLLGSSARPLADFTVGALREAVRVRIEAVDRVGDDVRMLLARDVG